MEPPIKIITITEIETAWLAGLLEGEGSFLLAPPSSRYSANVSISLEMTDEDVIAKVSKIFGNKYHKTTNRNPQKWKSSYSINVRGRKAIYIMNAILPYMGLRRTQRINEVLASITRTTNKFESFKVTTEIRQTIIKEHLLGKSARKIGRELNLHHETICKVIRQSVLDSKTNKQ